MFLVMTIVSLLLQAADFGPATDEPYRVSGAATRRGQEVRVELAITKAEPGGKRTVVSEPRLVLNRGDRGSFEIGTRVGAARDAGAPQAQAAGRGDAARALPAAAAPNANGDDIHSGLRVDVVTVVGEDTVLVLATLVEAGVIIWADAKRFDAVEMPGGRRD
jgi:hypothetical protein